MEEQYLSEELSRLRMSVIDEIRHKSERIFIVATEYREGFVGPLVDFDKSGQRLPDYLESNTILDVSEVEPGKQLYHMFLVGKLTESPEDDPLVQSFKMQLTETLMKVVSLVDVASTREYVQRKAEEAKNNSVLNSIRITHEGNVVLKTLLENKYKLPDNEQIVPGGSIVRVGDFSNEYSLKLPSTDKWLDSLIGTRGSEGVHLSDLYKLADKKYDMDFTWIRNADSRNAIGTEIHRVDNVVNDVLRMAYMDFLFENTPDLDKVANIEEINRIRSLVRSGDYGEIRQAIDWIEFMNEWGKLPSAVWQSRQKEMDTNSKKNSYARIYEQLKKTHKGMMQEKNELAITTWGRTYPEASEVEKEMYPSGFEGYIEQEYKGQKLFHENYYWMQEDRFIDALFKAAISDPPHQRFHLFKQVENHEFPTVNIISGVDGGVMASIILFGVEGGNWGASVFIGNPRDNRVENLNSEEFCRNHISLIKSYLEKNK